MPDYSNISWNKRNALNLFNRLFQKRSGFSKSLTWRSNSKTNLVANIGSKSQIEKRVPTSNLALKIKPITSADSHFIRSRCSLISSWSSSTRRRRRASNCSGNTTVLTSPSGPVQPRIAAALIWSYRNTTTCSISFIQFCFSIWKHSLEFFIRFNVIPIIRREPCNLIMRASLNRKRQGKAL